MKAKSTRRLMVVLASLALAVGLVAGTTSSGAKSGKAKRQTIAQTAAGSSQFDTLVSLLGKAGLVETLNGKGRFTVFAPTDAAFAKVPRSTLDALGSDPAQLKSVLLYHVAAGKLTARKVAKRSSIKTVNGERVRVRVTRKGVKVNNARVVAANVAASNGVIHAIDRVLLPPRD
jgi:uncharacterized surface protein with fasciclin (FAS1) repeats